MLEVAGLMKRFGALEVTRDVSLSLARGERHGVIGPNGAGKTTLFNLVSGELLADAGRISLDGTDISRAPPHRRAHLGLARSFQRNSLFEGMTVGQNLSLSAAVHRRESHVFWRSFSGHRALERAARATAEQLGLMDEYDTPVEALSYGTQRQVEVGLALITEPRVLMLDEPTAGMSPEETTRMKQVVSDLPSDLAVLIIEHDMDVVFDIADRVTVLDYGQVLVSGTPGEIRTSAAVRERYLGEDVGEELGDGE